MFPPFHCFYTTQNYKKKAKVEMTLAFKPFVIVTNGKIQSIQLTHKPEYSPG